jgi:hypothetical protein
MTRIISLISLILLSLSFIPNSHIGSVTANAAETNGVYISEVNYAGSINNLGCKKLENTKITCANDKWLELYNSSPFAVNLNGWVVAVGKEHADPQKFATSFRIDRDLIIQPNSYVVLLNRDKNLTSTLELAKVDYSSFGSLFGISGNTSGQKYIRVALLKESVIVSKVELLNMDTLESENGINQSKGQKYSIYFESAGSLPKFSSSGSAYFENNYATPGLAANVSQVSRRQPEPQIQAVEVVVPAQINIQTYTNTKTQTNTKIAVNTNIQATVISQTASLPAASATSNISPAVEPPKIKTALNALSIGDALVHTKYSTPNIAKINIVGETYETYKQSNLTEIYETSKGSILNSQNSLSARISLLSVLILVSKFWWSKRLSYNLQESVFLDKMTLFAI